jgi:hypothetical protein
MGRMPELSGGTPAFAGDEVRWCPFGLLVSKSVGHCRNFDRQFAWVHSPIHDSEKKISSIQLHRRIFPVCTILALRMH